MSDATQHAHDWREQREEITRAIATLEHAGREDDRHIIDRRRSESAASGLSVMLGCYDVLMVHREQLLAEVQRLTAERDALCAALSRHGRHDTTCPLRHEPNLPGDSRCTCGFSAALERPAP